MNTNTIKSNQMTNRTHTHGQLARAQRTLNKADHEKRQRIGRLAAKYGVTVRELRGMTTDQLARLIANAHMGLQPATPAEVRAAELAVAKADGITVRQVRARERQAHTRLAGRGKLYRADILGKGVQA